MNIFHMQAKRDHSDCTSSSIPVLSFAHIIQAVLEARPDVLFEVGLDDTSGLYIYARRNALLLMLSFFSSSIEPSVLPEPQKNESSTRPTLVRRATSRAVSRDPSEAPSLVEGDSQQPAPRRVKLAARFVSFRLRSCIRH